MKLVVVILVLLTSPGVLACDLSLVAPAKSALGKPVQARAALAEDTLSVGYSVSTPPLNAQKSLGAHQIPLHVRRRGVVCDIFGNRVSVL